MAPAIQSLLRRASPLAYAAVACGLLLTCTQRSTLLERVHQQGVLKVASVYGRTTCYAGSEGLAGYECDIVHEFAQSLGLTAEVTFCHSPADALKAVLEGRADIAAAGLTAAAAGGRARFTTPIDRVGAQLVYRMGRSPPKSPGELAGRLVVAAGSDFEVRLRSLQGGFPSLVWETTTGSDPEDLLLQVAKGDIDYTLASSSLVSIQQRYYPQLRVAFDIGAYEDVAFALAPGDDLSLHAAAQNYLKGLSAKTLARLHDRYYGHVEEVDYFTAVTIATHMRSRLPRYTSAFRASAERHRLDWRLLAAVGYQESHWDPSAVSYTGVRGLMMLTQDTAARYKVSNRDDPGQSIEGGAKVLADLYRDLPREVQEPDRSWMVLAAYNQGLGHLLDAMALAKARGGNPAHWLDVRDAYPLLARPRWYAKSKYGYVRGNEAVDFVGNVRSYYDIISWLLSGAPQLPPPTLKLDSSLRTAQAAKPEKSSPASEPEALTDEQLLKLPLLAPAELADGTAEAGPDSEGGH